MKNFLAMLIPCALFPFVAALAPAVYSADTQYPLKPPDLSSPRATLNTFLITSGEFSGLLHEEYRDVPTRAGFLRKLEFERKLERMLDLSSIPPAARRELGRDAIHYLYDVLSRIELPSSDQIPDASAYAETEGDEVMSVVRRISWTIPNTEITLERASEGPRAGEFLFSSSTVARVREFYGNVSGLPYRRDVPLQNYAQMRSYLAMGGWMIPSSFIEAMPKWLKYTIYHQAVWKWTALFMLIFLGLCLVALIHRWTQRRLHGHSPAVYLSRLLTPLTLLLIPLVLYVVNRQLTLTGWISGGVTLLAEAFVYYALAWILWSGSIAVSEAIIASPKVRDRSLDAQVLRLAARAIAIVALAVIVLHISNRLGAPLYSLVAGVGIGGLAIALAVRSSLENILGGLMLFVDKPVRIGDFCRFGDEYGTVEDIGMRSTRLRKLDDTLVTIPNAEFSQRDLTNYARVRRRLYNTTLGLRYETSPEQLRYVIADIRSMLLGHPKVSPDQLQVRFHSFGAYSLDILVFAYVRTRDILNFRAICEDINFRIMDIVQEAGTGFAFPSQTTYIGQDTGLDDKRGQAAEAQVQAWRSGGRLPFPEFDEDQRREMEDRLDYPPEGSPDFKSGD